MRSPRNDPLGSDIVDAAPARESEPEGAAGSARESGPDGADGPERRCILSGAHDARDRLIRLAVAPDGSIHPDALARAPGRGAWIGVSRAELEKAQARGHLKGALARALKGAPVAVPEDLGARIEAALIRAVTDRLGLELKAGRILLGSDRIAEHARAGRVAWLGHAADASEDGNRKLDQAYRVGLEAEGTGLAGTVLPLDRAALSVALGRDNVVHLALTDSAAADRLAVPLQRLLRFIGASGPSALPTESELPDESELPAEAKLIESRASMRTGADDE